MPLTRKLVLPKILHGADYNPEQWPSAIWQDDVALMERAGVNAVTVGIFAWFHLEPEEGRYDFGWLDEAIGLLKKRGIAIILATPSGARPPWMAHRYPEVLRVSEEGIRNLYGRRHNHCPTSPLYRTKVAEINRRLARRYGQDMGVVLWHVSNEYGGECHCSLCQDAFRTWLRARYGTLDRLNSAWWGSFWSHRYTDWVEIDPPSNRGEKLLHGLTLAWRRFVTDQTIDFFRSEVAAIREEDPSTPVTTNFMGNYEELDYGRFAREVDVVCWDSYPAWHAGQDGNESAEAAATAMQHDLFRGMGRGAPFLLMESTPSQVSWQAVNKLKRPGMHLLASLQAVAHGSDAVNYFQWRKSRGAAEKFHGAVIGHDGGSDTRTFSEVAELGRLLARLSCVTGTQVPAQIALLYDWETRWAFESCQGFRNDHKNYSEETLHAYRALWQLRREIDVIDQTCDLAPYRLLITPTLYLLRPGFAEKVKEFVKRGGIWIASWGTGWVDEDDLVFAGGQPGPLREVLGLDVEETDSLCDGETVPIVAKPGAEGCELAGNYVAREICERLRLRTARALAHYGAEFYKGEPCLCVNTYGAGRAYYISFQSRDALLSDLLAVIDAEIWPKRSWPFPLPTGIDARKRLGDEGEFLFLMNFTPHSIVLRAPEAAVADLVSGRPVCGPVELPSYGIRVLRRGGMDPS